MTEQDNSLQTEELEPILELGPDDSLGNDFLRAIPEQDRAIVEKYIKDWDGKVTKKFQSIHNKYAPYKELGDVEELQKAMELASILSEDPFTFYKSLEQTINELKEQGLFNDDDDDQEELEEQGFDLSNLPPDLLSYVQSLESRVDEIAQTQQEKIAADEERILLQELDQTMKKLHTDHGDFDDDWVLLQMSRNVEPEQAIANWNKMLEDRVGSSPRKAIPRVMSGNGNVPGNQAQPPSKLSRPERLAYMAQMLAASQD